MNYGMSTFGKKKGPKHLPKPLFLLVEMNGIEPSTYALRTHILSVFWRFPDVSD
jgi:hypothetical protein